MCTPSLQFLSFSCSFQQNSCQIIRFYPKPRCWSLPLPIRISGGSIISHGVLLLPPATKLGQGYVFTHVCDSVHGGCLSQCMLGYTHPPGADTFPASSACKEIQATSGRYASYWNAYLFGVFFAENCMEMKIRHCTLSTSAKDSSLHHTTDIVDLHAIV